MPQDIRVLQCFDCHIFQADIVKKSKKWKCRICEVQQTVRKEVFRGSGTECRLKAQELNMQKGLQQNNDFNYLLTNLNHAEVNNDINKSHLPDGDEDEIISNNMDITPGDNLNDLTMSTENPILFNFANTQKWSKSNSVQKSLKQSTVEHNDSGSAKKKSKWDSYV